jgi:hypothetical protein
MNARAIPSPVAQFRAEYRAAEISPSYSGTLHFLFTSFSALAVIGFSIWRLHSITPIEWVTVPLTFLYANVVEYVGHKGPMHHPVRLLRTLFVRHTMQHHRFFTHEAMAYEGAQDYKMVLFPPVMIVFFVGLHAVPVGLLLYYLTTRNVAYLFVATAIGYFLTYEWLHFAYHLREDSLPGRLPLMKRLRRLHTQHHDPTLMSNYNFNITFPICDYLFGTRYGS